MAHDLDLNPRATLTDLVARLEDHGVEVPGLARWRELKELTSERYVRTEEPSPELPADLLSQSEEQMRDWADRRALHQALRTKVNKLNPSAHYDALEAIDRELDPALKVSIRDNAGSIIAALRPAFDEAANALRTARSLGVRDTDTVESLFHDSDEKRNAWSAAKGHAATLDDIFETRQILSTVADVPPTLEFEVGRSKRRDVLEMGQPSGVDWSVTILKPEMAYQVGLKPLNRAAPWQRWLAIADHLQLSDPKPEDKSDPRVFQRQFGMTPQQAAAQAKGMGDIAKAEAAAIVSN